jgi:hypothetical protein
MKTLLRREPRQVPSSDFHDISSISPSYGFCLTSQAKIRSTWILPKIKICFLRQKSCIGGIKKESSLQTKKSKNLKRTMTRSSTSEHSSTIATKYITKLHNDKKKLCIHTTSFSMNNR